MKLIQEAFALHECEEVLHGDGEMDDLAMRVAVYGPGNAIFGSEVKGYLGVVDVIGRGSGDRWAHAWSHDSKERLLRIMGAYDLVKFTLEHSVEICWCQDAAKAVFEHHLSERKGGLDE